MIQDNARRTQSTFDGTLYIKDEILDSKNRAEIIPVSLLEMNLYVELSDLVLGHTY